MLKDELYENKMCLKSMDWFLYDNGLRHERVNYFLLLLKSLENQE